MTVIDTSVWVLFFKGDERARRLSSLCAENLALLHPWVLGELLLGGVSTENRELVDALDRCEEPSIDELAATIARHGLANRGIGLVDTAVLYAALSGRAKLWTIDASLSTVAGEIGVARYTGGSE